MMTKNPKSSTPIPGMNPLWIAVAICTIAASWYILINDIGFFSRIESSAYDFRYSRFHHAYPSKQVVLVDIDKSSLDEFGPWPWPRDILAELALELDALHPKSVGWDIYFPSTRISESEHENQDAIFAEALNYCNSPQITGYHFLFHKNTMRFPLVNTAEYDIAFPQGIAGGLGYQALGAWPGVPKIAENSTAQAYNNWRQDNDGTVRDLAAAISWENDLKMPISAAMLAAAGIDVGLELSDDDNIKALKVGERIIPAFSKGDIYLNFCAIPSIPASRLIKGEVPETEIWGKFVVVGSSTDTLGGPTALTPVGDLVTSSEIMAAALDTMLTRGPVLGRDHKSGLIDLFLLSVIGFISMLMAFPMSQSKRIVFFLIMFFGYFLFNCMVLFGSSNVVINLTLPLFVVTANFVFFSAGGYLAMRHK